MVQDNSNSVAGFREFLVLWKTEILWGVAVAATAALVVWLVRRSAPDRSAEGEMPFLDHLEELRWRVTRPARPRAI